MNILFILKSFDVGGVEAVTTSLANKFKEEGHQVVLWVFYEGQTTLVDRLHKGIRLIYGNGFKASTENQRLLRQTLISYEIDLVINQWGLPFIPAYTLKKASRGLPVKVIAVYHNDPSTNGRLKEVEMVLEKERNPLRKLVLHTRYCLYKMVTSASMRYVYGNSDKYVLLSDSFIKGFKQFTHIKDTKKLVVITNPVTIDVSDYELDLEGKEKEVVYVGRVDCNQKRVERIIETWGVLEPDFPKWKLRIIGDGKDRRKVERLVGTLGLKNVFFEGFQYPRPYYERSSLLVLASEYEGFGLVIVEAMSFGVVPVVLGSYSAVYDILDNGKDGVVVHYDRDKGFDAKAMAQALSGIMGNTRKRHEMAVEAFRKSRNFSIETIGSQWDVMLKNVSGGSFIRLGKGFLLKEKEIIYVGRLDYNQKRVFRIVQTWALLEREFPDWHLTIVGDGLERSILEKLVADLDLKQVRFEGFQHPKPYYERASILVLTSEYEGFPLVLAECMSFGVVPVVYGSYLAVYDIIEHGKNGIVVQPKGGKFDAEEMAGGLVRLMSDAGKRGSMVLAAMEKSRDYSIETIARKWEDLFTNLSKQENKS